MKSVTFALAMSLAAAAAQGAGFRSGPVEVRAPWSRPAPAGTTGAGFMTLENHGAAPDALIGVATPVAAEAQIHRSEMQGGVMSMSRESRVAVPAHGAVSFAPGGYHLMLTRLNRPLKTGESFPAVLTFASGRRIAVRFEVQAEAPAMAGVTH